MMWWYVMKFTCCESCQWDWLVSQTESCHVSDMTFLMSLCLRSQRHQRRHVRDSLISHRHDMIITYDVSVCDRDMIITYDVSVWCLYLRLSLTWRFWCLCLVSLTQYETDYDAVCDVIRQRHQGHHVRDSLISRLSDSLMSLSDVSLWCLRDIRDVMSETVSYHTDMTWL